MRLNKLLTYLFLFLSTTLFAQIFQKKIKGQVISDSLDVEGIHVMNVSTNVSTVTDVSGRFQVEVKLNDTLLFSAVQYQLKKVIISTDKYIKDELLVKLDEKINKLSEVVVRPHSLSGNLAQDIKRLSTDGIVNGVTMGLPNATVKKLTQSERKLFEASKVKVGTIPGSLSAGGSVSLSPIINAITGRTKMLKKRVELEKEDNLVENVIKDFGEDFFVIGLQIPSDKIYEFLYFSSGNNRFDTLVKSGDLLALTSFLKAMAGQFLKQLNEKE